METYRYKNIKSKVFFLWLITLLTMSPYLLWAQPETLSLSKVMQITGANNLTIREYQVRHQIALAQMQGAKEWWIPTIVAGLRMHHLNGSAMNSDGRFYLDINRDNFWTGAGLQFSFDLSRGVFDTKSVGFLVKANHFENVANKNQVILTAINKYLDVQGSKQIVSIQKELYDLLLSFTDQLKAQSDVGLSYKSEYLLAQSLLKQQQIALNKANVSLEIHSAKLAGLLGREPSTKWEIQEELVPLDFISVENPGDWDTSERPEIQQIENELRSINKMKLSRSAGMFLPDLNIGLTQSLFGDVISPTDISGQDVGSLSSTFEFNASLIWRIPLSHLGGGGDVRNFEARKSLVETKGKRKKLEMKQELVVALAQFRSAKENLNLAKESKELAKEALDQSLERQRLRTAKAMEVLQAHEYYSRAFNVHIESIIDYNKAQYAIYVASGKIL